MILEFKKQSVECIQSDRNAKVKYVIQSALYKVTESCDWDIEVQDEILSHNGINLYSYEFNCKRTVAYEVNSKRREYKTLSFKISSEDITLKELFTQAVIEVRRCQK